MLAKRMKHHVILFDVYRLAENGAMFRMNNEAKWSSYLYSTLVA
jgi:hypothetical protein